MEAVKNVLLDLLLIKVENVSVNLLILQLLSTKNYEKLEKNDLFIIVDYYLILILKSLFFIFYFLFYHLYSNFQFNNKIK